MSLRIYIASALASAPQCNSYQQVLESRGYYVVSTWHSVVEPGAVDPHDEAVRREIMITNLGELSRAECVLGLLTHNQGRCAYVEIGYALALSKPVVYLVGERDHGNSIASAHPLCRLVRSSDAVYAALASIEHELGNTRAA